MTDRENRRKPCRKDAYIYSLSTIAWHQFNYSNNFNALGIGEISKMLVKPIGSCSIYTFNLGQILSSPYNTVIAETSLDLLILTYCDVYSHVVKHLHSGALLNVVFQWSVLFHEVLLLLKKTSLIYSFMVHLLKNIVCLARSLSFKTIWKSLDWFVINNVFEGAEGSKTE